MKKVPICGHSQLCRAISPLSVDQYVVSTWGILPNGQVCWPVIGHFVDDNGDGASEAHTYGLIQFLPK